MKTRTLFRLRTVLVWTPAVILLIFGAIFVARAVNNGVGLFSAVTLSSKTVVGSDVNVRYGTATINGVPCISARSSSLSHAPDTIALQCDYDWRRHQREALAPK